MNLAGARPAGQMVSGMDGDVSLVCCSRMEQGEARSDRAARLGGERERPQAAHTVRDGVPTPSALADLLVVVMKPL
jgi:hypothetical protein